MLLDYYSIVKIMAVMKKISKLPLPPISPTSPSNIVYEDLIEIVTNDVKNDVDNIIGSYSISTILLEGGRG